MEFWKKVEARSQKGVTAEGRVSLNLNQWAINYIVIERCDEVLF